MAKVPIVRSMITPFPQFRGPVSTSQSLSSTCPAMIRAHLWRNLSRSAVWVSCVTPVWGLVRPGPAVKMGSNTRLKRSRRSAGSRRSLKSRGTTTNVCMSAVSTKRFCGKSQ